MALQLEEEIQKEKDMNKEILRIECDVCLTVIDTL